MTRVVSKQVPGSVYIGRAGRGEDGYFGNPLRAGERCAECGGVHLVPGDTVPCFEVYFARRVSGDEEFKRRALELKGKFLFCPGRCKARKLPCHGDVIARWADDR